VATEIDQCKLIKLEIPCDILELQSATKPSVAERGNIARCVTNNPCRGDDSFHK